MRKTLTIGLLIGALLAPGCGDKKKRGGAEEAGPGQDWSGRALKPVDQKIGGVAIQLSLPDKLKLESSSEDRLAWRADLGDYFSEPHVTVMVISSPPKTLDEATKHYLVDQGNVVVRKEAIAGGFQVTHHSKNKGLLYAVVWKSIGGKTLSCQASQAKQGGVPNFEKTQAWLEKICLSLQAK